MNGTSTAAGLGTDDGSATRDHQQRLFIAASHLIRAKEVLRHKITHETTQACFLIDEALGEIVDKEIEAFGERLGSGEGLHGQDPQEA